MAEQKLNAVKFGLALGILCAIYALFVIIFTDKFPMNVAFLSEIYGWLGADRFTFLKVVYCFVDGFVGGWIFAWIYNKLL